MHQALIGAVRDEQFGPAVMVGFGGGFVEVLKDVSFKIAPVSHNVAREMVESLQLFPTLDGIRGQEKLDVDALVDAIVKVSRVIVENEEVKEIDINPVRLYTKGMAALDGRVII